MGVLAALDSYRARHGSDWSAGRFLAGSRVNPKPAPRRVRDERGTDCQPGLVLRGMSGPPARFAVRGATLWAFGIRILGMGSVIPGPRSGTRGTLVRGNFGIGNPGHPPPQVGEIVGWGFGPRAIHPGLGWSPSRVSKARPGAPIFVAGTRG